jgi:clan AA aspartic protease
MIVGVVQDYEARVPVEVRGAHERAQQLEAVVDTGYDGCVSLRPLQITALGLEWQRLGRGTLADGSECLFDVYAAEVVWDGRSYRVLIDEADSDPLVGMALLDGFELRMECREQGRVEITRLLE